MSANNQKPGDNEWIQVTNRRAKRLRREQPRKEALIPKKVQYESSCDHLSKISNTDLFKHLRERCLRATSVREMPISSESEIEFLSRWSAINAIKDDRLDIFLDSVQHVKKRVFLTYYLGMYIV